MPDQASPEQTTTPDLAAYGHIDRYDHPELSLPLRLIAVATDSSPEDLYGVGEGDGAYDQVTGILADDGWRTHIAIANTMGLVGDRGSDDVVEAVTEALHEYREMRAELARVRPVVDAARAAGQAWGEHDLRAVGPALDDLSAAVAALDGDAAATPATAGRGDPDPGALIGRTDDWWVGYSAGCEASHAIGCSAVEAERDHLREQLERCEVVSEQRIADLQAEFARRDKIRDRQLDAARASLAAVSSAPPADVPARVRAAAHAASTAMDKGVLMSETGDGAESVLAVGHLHLIAEYLERHPDWPSAQAIVRALATPTTEETT